MVVQKDLARVTRQQEACGAPRGGRSLEVVVPPLPVILCTYSPHVRAAGVATIFATDFCHRAITVGAQ